MQNGVGGRCKVGAVRFDGRSEFRSEKQGTDVQTSESKHNASESMQRSNQFELPKRIIRQRTRREEEIIAVDLVQEILAALVATDDSRAAESAWSLHKVSRGRRQRR